MRMIVLGDAILDRYISGTVHRISPEAPIPILSHENETLVLGGAANVAQNLKSLQVKTTLITVVGDDYDGKRLANLLESNHIHHFIIHDKTRQTTVKTRFVANNKQLLRLDQEDIHEIGKDIQNKIIETLKALIKKENVDFILLQDYDKGFFTKELIDRIIEIGQQNEIKIGVDPKKRHFCNYRNISFIKPNKKEFCDYQNQTHISLATESLITKINKQHKINHWFITLSKDGIYHQQGNEAFITPTKKIDVVDVCGAGDIVFVIIAILMSQNMGIKHINKMCNMVGSIACSRFGTTKITFNEFNILKSSLQIDI